MIIITGQTATGKTKLALKYAKKYHGELVNFDSRQVYKYMDIVTGKDKSVISNQKLTIWLYDIVTTNKYYSSFEYIKDAQNIIKDIEKRGKIPILVGGSYFYLKHLLYGFDYKVPPDFKLREKLNKKSVNELQKILFKINPKLLNEMNNSDRQNPRRLIRRIEIITGVEVKGFPTARKSIISGINFRKNNYNVLSINQTKKNYAMSTGGNETETGPVFIGLRYKNKDKLREAIKSRVEKRLKQGAIDEVKKLLKKGYKKTDPGLKTIGYKQIIEFLERKISKENLIEKWINAEMQYAKRQYTFMKKDKNIKWKVI